MKVFTILKMCIIYFMLALPCVSLQAIASILVVAPHPDDDIIISSGVIADAVSRGEQVTVVFMTNGDIFGVAEGLVRQSEAVDAQIGHLGTTENDLIFLGYPDGSLGDIYRLFPDVTDVFTTSFGQSTTYGNRGLGQSDYHSFRFGSPANYNGFNIVSDLTDIIDTYRPDHIFTTSEFDQHTDHSKTYDFIILALQSVFSTDSSYTPSVHKTVVWSTQPSIWPEALDPTSFHIEIPDLNQTTLLWADRESINVPLSMQDISIIANPKINAVNAHQTQDGILGVLGKFIHKDEIFWVENPLTSSVPPVVNAGPSISVIMGNTVQLDGSGSFDINAAQLAYTWTQLSGPPVILSDVTSATPQFAAPTGLLEDTVLRFQLIVNNNDFSSIPDHVEVTVMTTAIGQNISPLVSSVSASSENIGSSQTALKAIDGVATGWPVDFRREWATMGERAGAWIELNWNEIYAVNRIVLFDRPNTADQIIAGTLHFSDQSTLSVGPLENGGLPTVISFPSRFTNSVRFTVDQVTATTINTGLAEIEVYGEMDAGINLAPTAVAGDDQIVLEGASVQLNGSGSSDPNNDPLNYQWVQISGITVTLSDNTVANPTFTAPSEVTQNQLLVFELVVDDGLETSSADSVTITVSSNQYSNIAPSAVVTASSENTSTTQTALKAVDGVATGYPVDFTREWVTRGEGAGAWLELNWGNAYIVDRVLLYDRPNGQDHIESASLSFSDGSTVPVGVLDNGGGVNEILFPARTVSNMRITIDQVGPSSANIGLAEIEVFGSLGVGVNLAPIAVAGLDQTTSEGELIVLDGSGSSDPNGDSINYQWTQVSGVPIALTGSMTVNPSFIAPMGLTQNEDLVFQLVVDDGLETSLPDLVTITVNTFQNFNIAPSATITASSENVSTSQTAVKAIDGVASGYPVDFSREWSTVGQGAGSWIELTWSNSQTVDRIVLHDRPNGNDQITAATLNFSDGSVLSVGALENGGSATEIVFTPRIISSVRLTVDQVSPSSINIGLAEIEVYASP
ncbi:MAG: PIG-L family deacetylase [Candidatus Thiodiazotropha sp. (ex Lucinoma borealis)]|nr:PIG-L family deacetylase [Candidatus Thiodiazotropha sp. (ex Lucinoma borealis)]